MAEAPILPGELPFTADAVIDADMRLRILGPEAALQVIVGASPEVVASAVAGLEAATAADRPVHPDLASLHVAGRELCRQAENDQNFEEVLVAIPPKRAYTVGVFVAASSIWKYLADLRSKNVQMVGERAHEVAQELLVSARFHGLNRRQQAFGALLEFSLDGAARAAWADSAIENLAATMGRQRMAEDAMAYWASQSTMDVEDVAQYADEYLQQSAKGNGVRSGRHLQGAPEFVSAVVTGAELVGDVPDIHPLDLYAGGVRRAVAYISLVTAKTASGEWSSSIYA